MEDDTLSLWLTDISPVCHSADCLHLYVPVCGGLVELPGWEVLAAPSKAWLDLAEHHDQPHLLLLHQPPELRARVAAVLSGRTLRTFLGVSLGLRELRNTFYL